MNEVVVAEVVCITMDFSNGTKKLGDASLPGLHHNEQEKRSIP